MKSINLPWFLILLFISLNLSAQTPSKIDSLNHVLTLMPEDSIRIAIYGELCWIYAGNHDTETARKYADSIMTMGQEKNIAYAQAFGNFYYGSISRFEGNYDAALAYMEKYIHYQEQAKDSLKLSNGLFQKASVLTSLGEFEKALTAYYQALNYQELKSDTSGMNYTLNGIGSVLRQMKKYDGAIEVYKRVLETDSLNSDVILNLGNVYMLKNDHESGLKNYRKALKIDKLIGNQWAIAYDLENLGNYFLSQETYDSALVYHLDALTIRDGLKNDVEKALSMSQVGFTYNKMGRLSQAEAYLTKALELAEQKNAKPLVRDIYQKLAILYKSMKSFEVAYDFLFRYANLNDSLINETSLNQINELKTKYETAKKDQQIVLLSKENEIASLEIQRQSTLKNSFIIGSILATLLSLLMVYLFWQRMHNQKMIAVKNEEIKEANFKKQLVELESKALQSQMNPHFVFNCMNAINQMILANDNDNASKYLTKFYKLLRMILEHAETKEVVLKDELAMLQSYIDLEELRFNGKIDCEIDIEEDIDQEEIYLPSMVLQPFVENAIWHGLLPKKDVNVGKIFIQIRQEGSQLICYIEDNGIGREKALELQQKSVMKKSSLGLKITEERLKLLSKELKQQFIKFVDLKDALGKAMGTRVEVIIPYS